MSQQKHKRREIMVDSKLQLGLAMNLIGWLYFYVVAFALVANAPAIWDVLTAPETDAAYYDAVQRMQWFTQFTVIPLALTFVCVAAHSVVLTHRIAGPIYRIRTVLRGLAERQFPNRDVTLRDKDYFKDVAVELNSVIITMREDAARERRMNTETMEGVRQLLAAMEKGDRSSADLVAMVHSSLDSAERLDKHLASVEPAAPIPLPEADVEDVPVAAETSEPVAAELHQS